jgi:hypothetical protein
VSESCLIGRSVSFYQTITTPSTTINSIRMPRGAPTRHVQSQNTPKKPSQDVISQLREMFPGLERDVIGLIVESTGDDFDSAINQCLALTDDSPVSVAALNEVRLRS